jgi:hypothetical protein
MARRYSFPPLNGTDATGLGGATAAATGGDGREDGAGVGRVAGVDERLVSARRIATPSRTAM